MSGSTSEMVEDLAELVRCESPSADLAAVARSAEVVAALGHRVTGAEPEVIDLEGRTHLRWRFGAGDRALLLGHHDTVWPIGSLDTHPWQVVDGVATGPGCFDMKAGLVQLFHAVAALDDPTGITILVTGDEELGAPSSKPLIEQEARRAGHAFVLEASADGGALKVARKGVALYEVQAHGRAAHAGLEPHLGANATVAIARAVLDITALSDPERGLTVVPTLLTSGTAANTIPSLASLRVDVRSPTARDQEQVGAALHDLVSGVAGVRLEVRRLVGHAPMEPDCSAVLFALAQEIAGEQGLPLLTGVAVGGASDGNVAAGVGALVLDGLGAVGGGAHADDEHVVLAEMPGRTRLLTGILERVLSERMNTRPRSGAFTR